MFQMYLGILSTPTHLRRCLGKRSNSSCFSDKRFQNKNRKKYLLISVMDPYMGPCSPVLWWFCNVTLGIDWDPRNLRTMPSAWFGALSTLTEHCLWPVQRQFDDGQCRAVFGAFQHFLALFRRLLALFSNLKKRSEFAEKSMEFGKELLPGPIEQEQVPLALFRCLLALFRCFLALFRRFLALYRRFFLTKKNWIHPK